jgi:hypothetical protein
MNATPTAKTKAEAIHEDCLLLGKGFRWRQGVAPATAQGATEVEALLDRWLPEGRRLRQVATTTAPSLAEAAYWDSLLETAERGRTPAGAIVVTPAWLWERVGCAREFLGAVKALGMGGPSTRELAEMIIEDAAAAGAPCALPPLHELVHQYRVSELRSRLARQDLVRAGLVVRERRQMVATCESFEPGAVARLLSPKPPPAVLSSA